MRDTVGIIDILKTIKKRWTLIFLTTLIAALISGVISYVLLKPVYEASTQILVNQKTTDNQIDYTHLRSNVDLINTYGGIIKSPAILEIVVDKLDQNLNWEKLNQNITVTSQENSQIFTLTFKDTNPAEAVKIVNTISETFQYEIRNIMSVDNVSILAKAEIKENPIPVKPKPLINIGIAIVIGLMGGMGIALLLDFMDNTVKNDRDVAALLGVPVLGTVQKMSKVHKMVNSGNVSPKMGGETIVSSVEK